MTSIRTPEQAVAFALAQAGWQHAYCLNFVWRCYAPDDSIGSQLTAQGYPPPISRAIDGWLGSPLKHYDRAPALGAPVYYSAARSGATAGDGHVAIYVGNGMIRSTDAGGYGVNATVPLDWPERNWGRKMLGWTGDILGHPLTLTTAPADTGSAHLQEEDDMPQLYTLTSPPAPSTSIYFVHPGGVSPVQSVDPEVLVLQSFAKQMNAGIPPVLTDGQYKLVDEVMRRRL